MQWIAPWREWWRQNGDWLKLGLSALFAVVGLASTVDLWMPNLSLIILAGIALVVVMLAINRLLGLALRERD